MKNIIALTIAIGTLSLTSCSNFPQPKTYKQTYSSFDLPSEHRAEPKGSGLSYNLQGAALEQVLKIYEQVSERTVIAGQLPKININLRTTRELSRIETLQMLDTVLAQNHIAMVLSGDNAVKAVPAEKARSESPPEIALPWRSLPESSSMMSRTVRLKYFKPSETVPILQTYANLPNSIVPVDSEQTLVFRDYSSNIRQQLKILEEMEQKHSTK